MASLHEIVRYCDDLLSADTFSDYCPNGLQVEGRSEVKTLVSGVTACQALVDAAIDAKADMLLVHHGYFWKGEDSRLTGIRGKRIKALFAGEVSLLAYHLPLDAHPAIGNNACLARQLGFEITGGFGIGSGPELGNFTELDSLISREELATRIEIAVNRTPQVIVSGPEEIKRIGWCTGAAQSYIDAAADNGLDAFISGEISEQTVHVARERGIHYFAAGHHATERYGVQALGQHLSDQFGINHLYIEIENPV